jgi:molybdenum cofactor cytidylyltransferase
MVNSPFAVLILAAGLSSRANGFKPLLPLGNGTIADHVVSIYLQNNVEVFIIVGYKQDEVRKSIWNRDVQFVENPDYLKGMFTSVQAGVRELGSGHKWFFVSPVDIPLISPATVARLMSEAVRNPAKILYPVHEGHRGHPPVIPSGLIPAILDWKKDGGLKAVLSSHKDIDMEIEVPDANILFDADTPSDYEELLRRYNQIYR